MLTSNWEVSTGRLPYKLIILIQFTQTFVISSHIDGFETSLPIGTHTSRGFA